MIQVEFCGAATADGSACFPPGLLVFHVETRNLSQGGVGLILPPAFLPTRISDHTPILATDAVFQIGRRVIVRLAGTAPIHGVVVRLRRVHNGFFEVGIQFAEKQANRSGDVARSTMGPLPATTSGASA